MNHNSNKDASNILLTYYAYYYLTVGISCPLKNFPQACIQHADGMFIVGCHSRNWYQARMICQDFGGDLAIIDTDDKMKFIMDYLQNYLIYDTCSWLFIGLRKEDWLLPGSSK